jgi:adenine-specific DNA-methyltransferase
VSPDVKEAHIVSRTDAKKIGLEKDLLRDSISGPQIKRYELWKSDQLIIYTTKSTKIHDFPIVENYLKDFKSLNTCQEVVQGKHPYWALHRPRDPNIFESPKFIGLTTSKTIKIIYDEKSSLFVTDAMYVFSTKQNIDPWGLMAIFHSKLFLFLYRVANQGESRVIPQVKASKLNSLPIPKSIISDKGRIASLSQFSIRMIDLNDKIKDAKLDHDQTLLQRQIDATDAAIDKMVYELYGLTEEEIKIVEGEDKI